MSKTLRHSIFFVLLGLLVLSLVGLFLTSGWVNPYLRRNPARRNFSRRVDQAPLVTAQNLAALAVTPGEHYFANEALRIADQDVDLAFASALRNAAEHPAPLTPEARQYQANVKEGQARLNADQQQVDRLTKLVASAREPKKEDLQDQLQLVHAQLLLDQDELTDAQRDLMRAGGDEGSVLQRQQAQHEKSQEHVSVHTPQAGPSGGAQAASQQASAGSLAAQFGSWSGLRAEHAQLQQAQQDTMARGRALTQSHDSLEQRLKAKKAQESPPTLPAAGSPKSGNAAAGSEPDIEPKQDTAAALSSVRQLSQDQQDLTELDKHIEIEQDLASVYGRWEAMVRTREQASLHRVIQSSFWIVLILLLMLLADHFINRFYFGLTPERNRLLTIRSVLHFATRALGFVLVLFVIFGSPSQLATILGLVGAGLTVALKDFIVGFFGWFALMGRNGMRRGDWVEINGVQGKVIEVGLLHTVILETGNWTGAGHPTGRKVTFVNSFPIEGHYFNFTTAGQWMWDEVQVDLRSGINPYPIVEAIQKIVVAETEANVKLAEQEWQKGSTTSGMHPLSAAPTISVRPTGSGVNLVVRYITRADEREEIRSRLYRAICDLLIGENAQQPAAENQDLQSAPASD